MILYTCYMSKRRVRTILTSEAYQVRNTVRHGVISLAIVLKLVEPGYAFVCNTQFKPARWVCEWITFLPV